QDGSKETIRDHWNDSQRDGQTHSQDLSESGVCLTGCKQPEIERSGRVEVPAEKTSSRQKNHQSIKTMASHPKRAAIISLHQEGHETKRIAHLLSVSQLLARKTIERFEMLESRSDRKEARTSPFSEAAAHFLSAQMKNVRLKGWRRPQERFADDTHRSIVFSDEKIFTTEPIVNPQNDRLLAADEKLTISRGNVTEKTTHPSSVVVWGATTSDGKTLLLFVDAGVMIDEEIYLKSVL
ncbi:unnamed protein product, partial [Heligmosomoides polygyrus]|uniref:Transposase n=1 Tax=Heligmosomoides polygyrus TaxID=6339 RepID=A0A183G4J1_HELPZ